MIGKRAGRSSFCLKKQRRYGSLQKIKKQTQDNPGQNQEDFHYCIAPEFMLIYSM